MTSSSPSSEVREGLNERLLRRLGQDGGRQTANGVRLYRLLEADDVAGSYVPATSVPKLNTNTAAIALLLAVNPPSVAGGNPNARHTRRI